MQLYVCSKIKFAGLWRAKRDDEDWPINASWIDAPLSGEPTPAEFVTLWQQTLLPDIEQATHLITYQEPGDILKGAFVEMGGLLVLGKPIALISPAPNARELFRHLLGTWIYLPSVHIGNDLDQGYAWLQHYPNA